MKAGTFKHTYLKNGFKVSFEEALDFCVDMWHENMSTTNSLQDALGLTDDEYEVFVRNPAELKKLLDARYKK